jgi:hypothetical protein
VIKKEGNIENKYVITFSRRSLSVANMQKAVNISNLISANVLHVAVLPLSFTQQIVHREIQNRVELVIEICNMFPLRRRIRNDTYEISSALSFDRKHQIVLTRLTIAHYTLHMATCKTKRPNKLRCVCNIINSVKKRLGP